MKTHLLTTLALGFALLAHAADSTYSFTYQARLCDDHGDVIKKDGKVQQNQKITLRLWDKATGGVLQWGRTYDVLTDTEGLFNLEVSDTEGSPVDAGEGAIRATLEEVFVKNKAGCVFIGVQIVGSDSEIVPRARIFAVPFAAVANDVRQISSDVTVGGKMTMGSVSLSSGGIVQDSGTATLADVKINGALDTVGTATLRGGLNVTGGTITFANDVNLASGKQVKYNGSDVVPVPIGGIIMWTKSSLPDTTHWAVCDGANGTPDLRDRFIVGAGNAYLSGATGGEATHKLTVSEMPGHRHSYVGDDQIEGIERTWDCSTRRGKTDDGYDASSSKSGNAGVYYTDSIGGNGAHENRPPYYALYFIMRIK